MDSRELNRSILRNNIRQREPGWSPQQQESAVDIAELAWKPNMGNGTASEIGIDVVKGQDRNRTA